MYNWSHQKPITSLLKHLFLQSSLILLSFTLFIQIISHLALLSSLHSAGYTGFKHGIRYYKGNVFFSDCIRILGLFIDLIAYYNNDLDHKEAI